MVLDIRVRISLCVFFLISSISLFGQTKIKGKVIDKSTGEELIAANVIIRGTTKGVVTEFDGSFAIDVDNPAQDSLEFSYIGYQTLVLLAADVEKNRVVSLPSSDAFLLESVEIKGQRISEKQKTAPLTVESLDLLAIKETPSDNFYDGLGNLKGVDLTAASLGFKVINTRGFNSTSPVRSLQIIDGIDNQSPGLNFSLGNFLGSPELDILKVDIIQGASSAYYGPNAFNGVIAMTTKNPFYKKGLAASIKYGQRNLLETALRYADVFNNKDGHPFMAYKINAAYLQADDWIANNYNPIDDSRVDASNPGRYDAVNIYGDEYNASNDFSGSQPWTFPGLGVFYRSGYKEEDLVDYDTKNMKANVGLYFRLQPEKEDNSQELIIGSSFANGTTIYQGDNRFALKGIQFFQHKAEWRKKDKFFLRAYVTHEDAGKSYDPYFTALALQDSSKNIRQWSIDYERNWRLNAVDKIRAGGYPQLKTIINNDGSISFFFDQEAADKWLDENRDVLAGYHSEAQQAADAGSFLKPGTPEFEAMFNTIISKKRGEGGTRFIDRSALAHAHGEYTFTPDWMDKIIVGANARYYMPESEGTVFYDSTDITIRNFEYGIYGGLTKNLWDNKAILSATMRMDKNDNFDFVFSPAASLVLKPYENNYLRLSFSSAVRNPTLADQYLHLNVGRAILSGNLNGVEDLYTVDSFLDYVNSGFRRDTLRQFNIDAIRPERVRTFEVGYRTSLFERVFVDAGYYYSTYRDFIGYNIGIDTDLDERTGFPQNTQVYRYSANSINEVTTQGFSIGVNTYFLEKFGLSGNYSWNNLLKADENDPIIPAFNTPEHKYNIGFSGRDIQLKPQWLLGFNVNYKWVQGFVFEGSPQFTGNIPSYRLVDAQVNVRANKWHTVFKIGASNLLDFKHYQTVGGPLIGRLAYCSITYDFQKH